MVASKATITPDVTTSKNQGEPPVVQANVEYPDQHHVSRSDGLGMNSERSLIPASADGVDFDSDRPAPLVNRGIERLRALRIASVLNDPTNLIASLATHLRNSISHSLGEEGEEHDASIFLTTSQNHLVNGLVFLASGARNRPGVEARHAMLELVKFMANSERFLWIDELGTQVAFALTLGRTRPAMRELYANLNHHDSSFRGHVAQIAWLVRDHLDPKLAAERILFNVGASHGGAQRGLATLWAVSANESHFWRCVDHRRPDFANSEAYGAFLDTSRPERRDAVLTEALVQLRDPASELSRYVRDPLDLRAFERDVVERVLGTAQETVFQARLPLM